MTLSNIKLLIVDDETVFRKNLAKLLLKRGISSEQAGDGRACLSFLENNKIDVVVLDVKLPDLNGIQVLRQIKEKDYSTEIILLTGEATTEGGVEGIKAGAFDYLSKPIEIEHLITKIKQAYDKILLHEEQKKEAEFRKKVEQQMMATERLAALGTLAVGVAHEINNPLAIINESAGWIHLLLQKAELKDIPYRKDVENALQKIEKSIDRAKHITHQLLGLVKNNEEFLTPVDMPELLKEAIQLVSRLADKKHVTIGLETDSDDITIMSDPYKLRQVLINLLSNAVYAEHESGKISVLLLQKGHEILLAIQDHGPGIPKENKEKIFDPFFTTKKPGEGTGLGLFVTRRMVEQLRGQIEFKSEIGHGTTFFIRLPIKKQDSRIRGFKGSSEMLESYEV
jgi:two-component system NtrC family sensor kinase